MFPLFADIPNNDGKNRDSIDCLSNSNSPASVDDCEDDQLSIVEMKDSDSLGANRDDSNKLNDNFIEIIKIRDSFEKNSESSSGADTEHKNKTSLCESNDCIVKTNKLIRQISKKLARETRSLSPQQFPDNERTLDNGSISDAGNKIDDCQANDSKRLKLSKSFEAIDQESNGSTSPTNQVHAYVSQEEVVKTDKANDKDSVLEQVRKTNELSEEVLNNRMISQFVHESLISSRKDSGLYCEQRYYHFILLI